MRVEYFTHRSVSFSDLRIGDFGGCPCRGKLLNHGTHGLRYIPSIIVLLFWLGYYNRDNVCACVVGIPVLVIGNA